MQKLNWLNAEHLQKKSNEELLSIVKDRNTRNQNLIIKIFQMNYLLLIIEAMKERVSFIKEFIDTCTILL
ncbi:MAG: hypothetical protein MZV64_08430 [Ignavibacteriales bacterium]|nr:hypothetical protein [Ignavibacteriales bacterium]